MNRFMFQFTKDQWETIDISVLAEHYFAGREIVHMTNAPEPFSLIWVLLDDGTLLALTYVGAEEVGGWSRHTMADDGAVECVQALPGGTYTEVYLEVLREVNGEVRRYIEIMAEPYFFGNYPWEEAVYVDCAKVYPEGGLVLTGLDHLEGETVAIFSDGANHAPQVVTDGTVTLESEADYVVVGLPYTGHVETLDFDAANMFNSTSLGQIRKINGVRARLFETGWVFAGRADQESGELNVLEPRRSDTLMDTRTPEFSGIFDIEIEPDWDLSARLRLEFRSPFPGTLSALYWEAMMDEG